MRRTCLVLVLATLIAGAGYAALGTPNEPITWSIVLNPYSNSSVSPYLVDVGGSGTTVFNPLAVPDVRRAINRYIDRAFIRDNILPAGSAIAYSPVRIGVQTSAQTITTPKNEFAVYLSNEHSFDIGRMYAGLSLWGSETELLDEVNAALNAVKSGLPGLQLVSLGAGLADAWEYDNKYVEVTVLRPTNSPVLQAIATHVGGLLQKCGLAVTYCDNTKANLLNIAMSQDSAMHAQFKWSVYVEGWVMTDDIAESIPHISAAQAYSAAFSQSYSQTIPPYFQTSAIDDIYRFMLYRFEGIGDGGDLLTLLSFLPDNDDAYWHLLTTEVMLGMENAVRIFLGFQDN